MNYQKHYNKLISRGQTRQPLDCYTEEHHIIPRCIGGPDHPDNLVDLTPEEHFVAHQLLIRLYSGSRKHKLACAINRMTNDSNGRRVNNKLYGWLKRLFSETHSEFMKERWRDEEFKIKISALIKNAYKNPELRKKHSEMTAKNWQDEEFKQKQLTSRRKPETREKRSELVTEHWQDEKIRAKHLESRKSPEYRARISKANKGRICITNGQEIRMIHPNEQIPEGFVRGRKMKIEVLTK